MNESRRARRSPSPASREGEDRRADIAQTRLPGGVPVDLDGQCPVMDEPAGSGELPEEPFLNVGRSQGEPKGLKAFHGSHFTTNRGTPYISALNGGVLRRFWVRQKWQMAKDLLGSFPRIMRK